MKECLSLIALWNEATPHFPVGMPRPEVLQWSVEEGLLSQEEAVTMAKEFHITFPEPEQLHLYYDQQ